LCSFRARPLFDPTRRLHAGLKPPVYTEAPNVRHD